MRPSKSRLFGGGRLTAGHVPRHFSRTTSAYYTTFICVPHTAYQLVLQSHHRHIILPRDVFANNESVGGTEQATQKGTKQTARWGPWPKGDEDSLSGRTRVDFGGGKANGVIGSEGGGAINFNLG